MLPHFLETNMSNKITKTNNSDSMLAGVAGGMAKHFGFDPVIMRLLWVMFFILTAGTSIVVYIIMALVFPEEEIS